MSDPRPVAGPAARNLRRFRKSAWIAAVCVAVLTPSANGYAQSRKETDRLVSVTFFDVGQGDAALIRTPNGKTILIDAGPAGAAIASKLRGYGIDTLDLAIASHNHADHIGGMRAVLEAICVKAYLENGMPATSHTYASVVEALERHRIPVLKPTKRRIDLGGGVILRIMASLPGAESQNDASVGVVLSYGKFGIFFSGDAEPAARQFWALADTLPRVQVLKVAHHGSSNGTDRAFLMALRPCIGVVSVGSRNDYGHPAPEVLELLHSARANVYRTDRVGTLILSADSSGRLTIKSPASGAPFPQPNVAACRAAGGTQ